MRIEISTDGAECLAFEEVLVWRGMAIIGYGDHLHAVGVNDCSVVTLELGSYFGHLYPADSYLLVASGVRLFRLEVDRTVLWESDMLGIDGVVVHETSPTLIQGAGEWDPPGGWRPFTISAIDGKPI